MQDAFDTTIAHGFFAQIPKMATTMPAIVRGVGCWECVRRVPFSSSARSSLRLLTHSPRPLLGAHCMGALTGWVVPNTGALPCDQGPVHDKTRGLVRRGLAMRGYATGWDLPEVPIEPVRSRAARTSSR